MVSHLEQSCPSISLPLSRPCILCLISLVDFLADPLTDQVFAKVLLTPVNNSFKPSGNPFEEPRHQGQVDCGVEENAILPFAKILTPSDANNGGGFSILRFCAESIFPPLNFQADPPVQMLSITDIQGTPRRHLLMTGWSKFVNKKKLIAGDYVVFMRDSRGKMFVGIRWLMMHGNSGDGARWREQIGMRPEAVVDVVERAEMGMPFEVLYYPRAGWADFIVRADMVDATMKVFWTAGIRVKMAVETEDSSKMSWVQGTIMAASMPYSGQCDNPKIHSSLYTARP